MMSYVDECGDINYIQISKLSNGQTVKIEFQETISWHQYFYNIYLVICTKRKHENKTFRKQTGKCGLEGLMWARNQIIEFEKYINEKHPSNKITIYTTWDDNRRRNVYERGLRNLGYEYKMIYGTKALAKTI